MLSYILTIIHIGQNGICDDIPTSKKWAVFKSK